MKTSFSSSSSLLHLELSEWFPSRKYNEYGSICMTARGTKKEWSSVAWWLRKTKKRGFAIHLGIIKNHHANCVEWTCFVSPTFYRKCSLFIFTRSCGWMFWSYNENAGNISRIFLIFHLHPIVFLSQYVAAFAVSSISSNIDRLSKPFNPLLGETYEFVRWVNDNSSNLDDIGFE